jgi:ATP-dependent Lon protease
MKTKTIIQPVVMPLLALRGVAVFPHMILHFDVGRKKSVMALNEAMKEGQRIFLVAQTDMRDDEPTRDNLYAIGTVAQIKQILHLSGETIKVLVEGLYRAKWVDLAQEDPYFTAMIEEIATPAGRKKCCRK